MFANVERERERARERDWCRHIKVNIASKDRQESNSGNSSTYFKFCVDLCKKKSDHTICLAVSILEYNINWNSKSAERAKAFWFFEGRTNSVVIHR